MANQRHVSNPPWSWAIPAFGAGLLVVKLVGIVQRDPVALLALAAVLLFGTVFAAVHHAELLAVKLGEPFGSILLAVAVTIIEVALIVSIMLSDVEGGDVVARDTVFAALMIVLNGIIGLCLVFGGRRHFEQTFQLKGASSALAVLGTPAVLRLILPNYTFIAGPSYSHSSSSSVPRRFASGPPSSLFKLLSIATIFSICRWLTIRRPMSPRSSSRSRQTALRW